MKITIPVSAALNGGSLYTLIDDLTNTNSGITKQTINGGTNLEVTDSDLIPVNMTQATLIQILAEGGEVENRIMAIKAPISLSNAPVPAGVPYRTNAVGDVKNFKDWLLFGSELWINTTDSLVLFYTNPLGSQADESQFLKGSEIELIRQIDTINNFILSIDEAQVELANPNYVKVDWNSL